jgi:hypothetical protein
MTKAALKIISDAMQEMNLAYALGRFNGKADPYFVGEYQETESFTEDGLQESTFLLTGFSRGSWLTLEEAKERIEIFFNRVGGKTVIADNGSAVAVFYAHSLIVPTNDAELKRIQINLNIKEWKVT